MGDNHSCKTFGFENVRIKRFDRVIITLTNVKNVPELKKKLISLGVLDSCGHKLSGSSGVLKVSKGALVVMKALKQETFANWLEELKSMIHH